MRKIVAAVAAAAFGAGATFAFVGAGLFRGAPENPNLTPCVKALDEAEDAAEILDQSEHLRYADECRALERGD